MLFILQVLNIQAQTIQNEWTYDSIKSYYKNYMIHTNDTSQDGVSSKYYRFESMMDYKFNKNSTISDYVSKVKDFNDQNSNRNVNSSQNSSVYQSNWTNISKEDLEISAAGRFTSIWINPNPPYNIISGTQSSGIWKTTNGQSNPKWKNLTSFKMKNCGISQIAVSPLDTNIIYASTSFSGSYVSWYGMGLIYSTDGGETWKEDKNLPDSFLYVTNWQWKTKLPIAFEPGTNNLLVGYENRVWRKNCTPSLESWEQKPVYTFAIPNQQAFMVYNIKFSISNPNLVVCSANNGSEKEIIYSFNTGNPGTWHEFDFDEPTIFNDSNLNYSEFHNSIFIDEDNLDIYLLIGVGNSVNPPPNSTFVKRTYLVRFKKNISQNIFEEDKIWTATEGSTTFLGATNGMEIIKENLGSYYLIIGQGARVVYTTRFTEDTSSLFSFTEKSNYLLTNGNKQTHADVRDLKYFNGKIYIATDGGISVSNNLCSNADDWVSLNGIGLTAQEILGFDNTEFDKDYIVCSAMDGNSFTRRNTNGVINYIQYTSNDRFDAAISKLQNDKYNNVMSINGGGPNDPSLLKSSTSVFLFEPPKASGGENYALKQFDFEDGTNNFFVGTTDVQKYDDFFNIPAYSNQTKWTAVSRSNINAPGRNTSFYTDGPITAFKSIKHPTNSNIIISVYAIKRASEINTIPPKLLYVKYDNSNSASPIFSHVNITPYTVNNITDSNNSLYKNWIQDIIIDETNPDRIWVCFGGTSKEITNVTGRVYHTENGSSLNPTWTDVSGGLPFLPILSMVYWKGTDDIIFAGTDVGVYVYNKSSGVWEMFMNNFPFITVPELDINYCSGTLRACTSGMGIWETPLPNLEFINSIPKKVTTSETWNVSMDIYQSVLVKSGATLIIKGTHNSDNTNSVEIRFPKNKKIMVEPGAKLIIDGATLTNHCDLWQGIEAYGQKNATQEDINQGRIIVKNGAIIENARKGISTSKGTQNGWDATSTGAIVECENSSFINNLVDIEILSSHRITTKPLDEKINKSYISKCKFETNNSYLFGEKNPTHIYLWDVNGVKIIGSYFVDNRKITKGSIGIKSIQSGFYVNEYCGGIISLPVASGYTCAGIRSVFENLEYGIQSFSQSNPKYSANISNSVFNNCSRGVYLNGVDNASIFLSNFNIKRLASTPLYEASQSRYGVYLDMCKSYKVENNNLIGDIDVESNDSSISAGIVLRNMHGENVTVNSNALSKLSLGIEAIGRNRGQKFDKGLQINCNTFSDSKFDIAVINDPVTPVENNICGIARNQGYPIPNNQNRLAGNQFGNTSPYLEKNYVNLGAIIDYYHHNPTSNSRVIPSQYFDSTKIVLRGQNIAYSNTTSCPSSFSSLLTPAQLRSHVITQEEILEGNLAALAEMIDGGNTEQFLLNLDLSNSSFIATNYFLLMNFTPYLSREVLLRVVEDGTALSNAMIRNILVACSQAAKDEEVQFRLDNRTYPLPQYMRDQINQGLIELSAMENEEREIGSYVAEIEHSVNETMWRATQDTVDLSSNIFDIFNEIEDYTLKTQLANWIDADDRRIDANFLIDEIGSNLQFEEDIQDYDIFRDMRNFRYQIVDNNLEANHLDQNNIDYLTSYLHYPDVNVSYAMAMLKLNNLLDYKEPVILPQENASRVVNLTSTKIITELDPSESSLEVSPNPVSDLFTAKYKILEKTSTLRLVITDVNGKELLNQPLMNNIDEIIVNCNQFVSGNYIITIKGNGIKSLSQKIIVSKR